MTSLMSTSFGDDPKAEIPVPPMEPQGTTRSLSELRAVLEFHQTERARRMYREHDDPMHRMFGDLPGGIPAGMMSGSGLA